MFSTDGYDKGVFFGTNLLETFPLKTSAVVNLRTKFRILSETYPSHIFFTRVLSCSPWKKIRNTDLYTWSPYEEKRRGLNLSRAQVQCYNV